MERPLTRKVHRTWELQLDSWSDIYFVQAVRNTIVFSLSSIFFSIFFGLMLALLANQKIMGQNFYRTAFFAPSVTSTIAIGIVFSFIYEPNMGLLNSVLCYRNRPWRRWGFSPLGGVGISFSQH